MPIIDLREQGPATETGIDPVYRATPLDEPTPETGDSVLGAAFRVDNTIGSALASQSVWLPDEIDPEFSPWERVKGTRYEPFWDRLISARSERRLNAMMADIDREEQDRRTLQAAGLLGVAASIGASVLDWPTLLPGGAFVRGAKGGYSALKSAGVVAGASALGVGVQEGALQLTQQTRPLSESVIGVGAGAVLGGLIGGAGARVLSGMEWRGIVERAQREMADNAPLIPDVREQEMQDYIASAPAAGDLGAAVRAQDTLDDLSVAGGAASAVAGAIPNLNPILRGVHSPSAVVRSVFQRAMETPIYMKKNFAGRPSDQAIETFMKEYTQGAVAAAMEANNRIWSDARKAGFQGGYDEFRTRIGRAMRRGDVDPDGNEYVTKAAQEWRKRVFDPLKDEAIKVGLLPPDVSVETATSYLSRIYSKPKIEANEGRFKQIVRDWVRSEIPKTLAAERKATERRVSSLYAEKAELDLAILRRESEAAERAAGEVDAGGFTEGDILRAVDMVRGGKRPPEPESLISWLAKQGGLADHSGELANMGLTNRARPGFVRKTRRSLSGSAKEGGLGFDDAALLAWQEGFFRGGERPSVREFLEALDDEWRGLRRTVRQADEDAARAVQAFDDVEAALSRMGVDVKAPRFGTSDDVKAMVRNVTEAMNARDNARIAELNKKIKEIEAEARISEEARFADDGTEDLYVDEIVDSVFAKITGREGLDVPHNITVAARGPLKERTFNIPDELIEEFLESDVELVGRRYARVMAADVELKRKFGDVTMKDTIREIQEDYAKLRKQAEADKSLSAADREKQIKMLSSRERRDIKDLQAVRDMLRGNYLADQNITPFARTLAVVNLFNYLRTMGGVVLSSLPDIARPMMVHGLGRYINDGVVPLVTNLRAVKLSRKEAKLAGAVAERILNTRMATLAEITDPYSISHPFERFMENSARLFSKLNGMVFWNDFMKSFSATITQTRLIGNAMKGWGKLNEKERAYMAFLGLDESMADRIARQVKKAAELDPDEAGNLGGVWVAGTELWDDPVARRAYRAALNKDVDSIIVTRGIGDAPLFSKTPIGRSVLQFKSFALATHQRALIRGLQEEKSGFLAGMLGATIVGMFVYFLKQIESNREISDNPGRWISEGLDRSGMMSIMFEISNTSEKFGGPGVYGAIQSVFPGEQGGQASRYAIRNVTGTLAGPTAGVLEDIAKLYSSANRGELKESDINAMRRLMPGATLPMIRSVLEYGVMPAARDAVQ